MIPNPTNNQTKRKRISIKARETNHQPENKIQSNSKKKQMVAKSVLERPSMERF